METSRPDLWKKTFSYVSEKIFPGLSSSNGQVLVPTSSVGCEVLSSLPLQMSLYFNVVFFPFWLLSMSVMLHLKFSCLNILHQFLVVTVFLTATANECLRLYLGYTGNLANKVPELAGFWLLTLIPQLPLQLFLLLNESILPQPLEKAVQTIALIFLISQLSTGFFALRNTSKTHAELSRLSIMLASQGKDD